MDAGQVITVVLGLGSGGALAVILKFTKRLPGQREKDDLSLAQGTLSVASGTVAFVKETYQEQLDRQKQEMDAMRADHAAYKVETDSRHARFKVETDARIASLVVELRAEKAEKDVVKRENSRLTERVKSLEDEVASLKASQH